jgi:hypothetical protein
LELRRFTLRIRHPCRQVGGVEKRRRDQAQDGGQTLRRGLPYRLVRQGLVAQFQLIIETLEARLDRAAVQRKGIIIL